MKPCDHRGPPRCPELIEDWRGFCDRHRQPGVRSNLEREEEHRAFWGRIGDAMAGACMRGPVAHVEAQAALAELFAEMYREDGRGT